MLFPISPPERYPEILLNVETQLFFKERFLKVLNKNYSFTFKLFINLKDIYFETLEFERLIPTIPPEIELKELGEEMLLLDEVQSETEEE